VPPPYGEAFSKETLIKSASSKAFAATTEARTGCQSSCCGTLEKQLRSVVSASTVSLSAGPGNDPLRDGFQATSLDQDEVERILSACIQHRDHWSGFKVAAMVLLGTAMGFRDLYTCMHCLCRIDSNSNIHEHPVDVAGDDLMDAKPSLLALTPVVRSTPVPMQPITWYVAELQNDT